MILFLVSALGAWASVAFVFSVGAWLETRRLVREARDQPPLTRWPAIAVLRPCAGLDPDLEENLLSTVIARYDGPREVYLLVASEDDPAHAVAVRVRARAGELAPGIRVEVVVTRITSRHNRKVAQLARAEGLSDAPVIAVVDSDISVDDETLPALVAALHSHPRAGASSCPVMDVRHDTLGDRASAALLTSTPHAFYCLGALAERSGGAHVLCGALIAIRREVLAELGGFASLERYLGEDFELARRLHARGYTIPTAGAPGRVTDRGRTFGVVVRRFARWCTVTRQQRPHLMLTYPLFLACGPLLLVFGAAAGIAGGDAGRLVAAGIAMVLLVRVAVAMALRRGYRLRAGPLRALGAMLLGELTLLIGFSGALGRPIVAWRGNRYRIGPGGLIELIP